MIESIKIENYKSFADHNEVRLPLFLVLVGDNGAGKTNFCDAIEFLQDIMKDGLRKALLKERRGSFQNILHDRIRDKIINFQLFFFGSTLEAKI